jgi:hypothetical membrane protein
MVKKLTIFGAIAVFFYLSHIIFGGILWHEYSHLMQPISDLTATGAPDKNLLSILTLIYGLCAITFAVCAYIYLKNIVPKITRVGLLLFIIMHVISITYGIFPVDLPGTPATFTGIMHIIITMLIIPLTILSPILIGAGLRKNQLFLSFAVYSIATGIFIFFAGGVTAYFFVHKLPYFGLVERINIGALQLWTLIFSIKLFRGTL